MPGCGTGWDALREYLQEKAPKKPAAKPAAALPAVPPSVPPNVERPSTPDRDTSSTLTTPEKSRARSGSTASIGAPASGHKRSESPGPGLFASLRNRFVGTSVPADPTAPAAPTASDAHPAGQAPLPNETQEAVQLRQDEIGTPDELVLVIHGIGQGLAGTYDSFSFVYACNAFRSVGTFMRSLPLRPCASNQVSSTRRHVRRSRPPLRFLRS